MYLMYSMCREGHRDGCVIKFEFNFEYQYIRNAILSGYDIPAYINKCISWCFLI